MKMAEEKDIIHYSIWVQMWKIQIIGMLKLSYLTTLFFKKIQFESFN